MSVTTVTKKAFMVRSLLYYNWFLYIDDILTSNAYAYKKEIQEYYSLSIFENFLLNPLVPGVH